MLPNTVDDYKWGGCEGMVSTGGCGEGNGRAHNEM